MDCTICSVQCTDFNVQCAVYRFQCVVCLCSMLCAVFNTVLIVLYQAKITNRSVGIAQCQERL